MQGTRFLCRSATFNGGEGVGFSTFVYGPVLACFLKIWALCGASPKLNLGPGHQTHFERTHKHSSASLATTQLHERSFFVITLQRVIDSNESAFLAAMNLNFGRKSLEHLSASSHHKTERTASLLFCSLGWPQTSPCSATSLRLKQFCKPT
jgi:hypothetical protein